MFGRAAMSPPVKSVTMVDVQAVEDVAANPGAQVSVDFLLYVPPVKVAVKPGLLPNVLGLPVAYEVVPETIQLSKTPLTRRLFHRRLRPGRS